MGTAALRVQYRFGDKPSYVITENPPEYMRVPDQIKDCVVFIGRPTKDGKVETAGTAFLLGKPIGSNLGSYAYLVTAKHVIDGIRKRGDYEVYFRVNFRDGPSHWVSTKLVDWLFHPTDALVDVAIFKVPDLLLLDFDVALCPAEMALSPEKIINENIGIGDEVFLAGLFIHHFGTERNIPIVRVGNIAAMPEEPVLTNWGVMDAYLIESRSIGGHSGSPVFVHLGPSRIIDGQIRFAEGHAFHWLGLMHGHWDRPISATDTVMEDGSNDGRVNMGIAIVVPAAKIMEVVNQQAMREKERESFEQLKPLFNLPVMDDKGSDDPSPSVG